MNNAHLVPPAIALVWAGVVVGGSVIATPAKFQAPSLTLPTALEVGRAQFLWVGVGEAVLCAAFLLSVALVGRIDWRMALAPAVLLGVQRLLVMPMLDARTVRIIAGEDLAPSSLHIVYICVEAFKIIALLVAAAFGAGLFQKQG